MIRLQPISNERRAGAQMITMDEDGLNKLAEMIARQVEKSSGVPPLTLEKHALLASMSRWFDSQNQLHVNKIAIQNRYLALLKKGFIVGLFAMVLISAASALYIAKDQVSRYFWGS
jgi:hypothetical protein